MSNEDELLVPEAEDEEDDGEIVVCWKDSTRGCGDDCAAFDPRCETDERFKPCILLNIQRQQANALANLANETKRQNDWYESEEGKQKERMEKTIKEHQRQKAVDDLPEPPEIKT